MKRKVAVTYEFGIKIDAYQVLSSNDFEVVFIPYKENCSEEEIIKDYKGFDYIVNSQYFWTSKIFDGLRGSLRLLAKTGVGVDTIDVIAAGKNGIAVCNSPGANATWVAEFTVSLMLTLASRICICNDQIKQGIWENPKHRLTIVGKTIGLLGFGNIGQKVAQFLSGFPVNLIAHDILIENERTISCNVIPVSLNELAERSDFVSVHVPYLPSTHHIVNNKFIARMKTSAFLINTSRGGTVDTIAIANALNAGHIAGFAADVFEVEPLETDSPLRSAKNTILTPHMAGANTESITHSRMLALKNILAFEAGTLQSIVSQSYRNNI